MTPEDRRILDRALQTGAVRLNTADRDLLERRVDIARENDPQAKRALEEQFAAASGQGSPRWGAIGDALQLAEMEGLFLPPSERNRPAPSPMPAPAPRPLTQQEMDFVQLQHRYLKESDPEARKALHLQLDSAVRSGAPLRWGRMGDALHELQAQDLDSERLRGKAA